MPGKNPQSLRRLAALSLCLICLPATLVPASAQLAPAAGLAAPPDGREAAAAPAAGEVVISEFRFRGAAGASDEFVELYNNTDSPVTVAAADGSSGWAVVAANTASPTPAASARFVVPAGTVIPARGHYLGVNSAGYGLGAAAAGDAAYTTGIVDGGSVALFNNNTPANWTPANRLDAVGFAAPAAGAAAFTEGTPLSPAGGITSNGEYAFVRRLRGGTPQDTGDNEADFMFVSTDAAAYNSRQSALGAPGPENLAAPVARTARVPSTLIFPCVPANAAPNRVRDTTPGPAATSSLGTLSVRRRWLNNTGAAVSRLRFRVVDVTTAPAAPGTVDLRAVGSSAVTVAAPENPCGTGAVTIQGTTLEAPAQPNGGGFNSTLGAGSVSAGAPLAPGSSVDLQFLLGVRTLGAFRFMVVVEALP